MPSPIYILLANKMRQKKCYNVQKYFPMNSFQCRVDVDSGHLGHYLSKIDIPKLGLFSTWRKPTFWRHFPKQIYEDNFTKFFSAKNGVKYSNFSVNVLHTHIFYYT